MKTIYSRYNRFRKEEFQVETRIVTDGSTRYVVKKALTAAANKHIDDIISNGARLTGSMKGSRVKLPAVIEKGPDHIRSEFIEGVSLEKMALEALIAKDKDRFLSLIDDYKLMLYGSFLTDKKPPSSLSSSPLFKGVDPSALPPELECLKYPVIDPILENFIIKDGVYYLVDYEWTLGSDVPVAFVLYRGLLYFYKKYKALNIEKFIPFTDILARYGITGKAAMQYQKMEDTFQDYAIGDNKGIRRRYLKKQFRFDDSIRPLLVTKERSPRLYGFILWLASAAQKLRTALKLDGQ